MAKGQRKKSNAKPAPKIVFKPFNLLREVLVLVGKPFYLLLSYLVVGSLFIFYWIGHLLLIIFRSPLLLLGRIKENLKKVRFEKIKAPQIVLPSLPKIKIPPIKLKFKFRLDFRQIIFFVFVSGFLFFFWFFILKDLPSPKELTTRKQEVSTKIYDRNGKLLYKIFKNKNRTPVALKTIPLPVRQATLAAEDAEFYNHIGFSVRGITRALLKNIKEGKLNGGSTITQQLVKNALLSPEKTLTRKIREIILSFEVELTYSKDQILEMYLNEVNYGGTAYGIEEASQIYFGKNAQDLSLAEAALLAGLPKSPTHYSPFGANPEMAFERQKEVLNLMFVNKFITKEEQNKVLGEKLLFSSKITNIKAPHFVMYVKKLLVEKYGEEMVEKGGLEVFTTLDLDIQEMAEAVVAKEINSLSRLRVGNGAALVLDPQTGQILAMVGSKDYFDLTHQGNFNVTTSLRQPGSSIKIVNYSYALGHGFTPATILDDSPVSFSTPGSPIYSPKNYDGKFRGKIPLRSALAESRNIPAVKVLASYGVSKMIEQGKKMGITTWNDPSRFGLSLTLGGGEVRLIDLAQVYATIANFGQRPDIVSILKITNSQKEAVETFSPYSENVLDPRVAFLIIDILKDNPARTPAFGDNSSLVIPDHPEVAVKTGTSNNLKDNLTLGFNQKILVAVWVGNNDSSPMSSITSGITGAAPIFNQIMKNLLKNVPGTNWEVPAGVVKIAICPFTNTLPCEGCSAKQEWFLQENVPQKACSPEWFAPKDNNIEKSQILEPAAKIEVAN